MNAHQVKEILHAYRPWTADATDPAVAEALAVVQADAELRRWFEEHCARQHTIRAQFQRITAPPGLKEQILSEHRAALRSVSWRRPQLLAAAAVLLGLGFLASVWWTARPSAGEDLTFTGFRGRMVRTAVRMYDMDFETNNLAQIRAYLASRQAHADYQLPRPLEVAAPTGCGVLKWQNQTVSMVCFRSGKSLPPGQKSDLFLFVIDRAVVARAPRERAPQFEQFGTLATASWCEGDRIYLLAAEGDEAFLKRFL